MRQPQSFKIFFMTEGWERYGFYVLQSVLVFFLAHHFNLKDDQVYLMAGSVTALAYINSIFGGLIADKILGYTRAIKFGCWCLVIGYYVLAITDSLSSLDLAVALITVGTGLLKPNLSSMLSTIYIKDNDLKDSGYNLYYVGIYVGATSGTLIGGYLKDYLGWNIVFLSASVGLIIAFFTFYWGSKKYKLIDYRINNIKFSTWIYSIIILGFLILISYIIISNERWSNYYFLLIALGSFTLIIYQALQNQGADRYKLLGFFVLVLFSIIYWGIYFQQFFSLALASERITEINIPVSSLPAIESLGIILFGSLINKLWIKLKQKNCALSIPSKFSLSFLLNSLSFLILLSGITYAQRHHTYLNIAYIIVAYLVIALGELCISPVALLMVSYLVPEKERGTMMGIYLLSIGLGGKFAGILATNTNIDLPINLISIENVYRHAFSNYFLISIFTFILSFGAIWPLKKLIK